MRAQRRELIWLPTASAKPRRGTKVIGAILTRFMNAPWEWDFFELVYNGSWGDYSTPDMWARIPEPMIPMNREHRNARRTAAREAKYRAEREKLDRKFGRHK